MHICSHDLAKRVGTYCVNRRFEYTLVLYIRPLQHYYLIANGPIGTRVLEEGCRLVLQSKLTASCQVFPWLPAFPFVAA